MSRPDPNECCWPSQCGAKESGIPQLRTVNTLFWTHLFGYTLANIIAFFLLIIAEAAAVAYLVNLNETINPDDPWAVLGELPGALLAMFVFFGIIVPIGSVVVGGACSVYLFIFVRSIPEVISCGDIEMQDVGGDGPSRPQAHTGGAHFEFKAMQPLNLAQLIAFWVTLALELLRMALPVLGILSIVSWIVHIVCYYLALSRLYPFFLRYSPAVHNPDMDNTVGYEEPPEYSASHSGSHSAQHSSAYASYPKHYDQPDDSAPFSTHFATESEPAGTVYDDQPSQSESPSFFAKTPY